MQKSLEKLHQTNHKIAYSISVTMAILISLLLLAFYNVERYQMIQKYQEQQQVAVDVTEAFFVEQIGNMIHNIEEIKANAAVKNYVNDMESAIYKREIEAFFQESAAGIEAITQIRILDTSGMERIRINKHEGRIEVVDKVLLQDKANRYYFSDAMAMGEHETYMSDFDLNVEHDKIVEPYEPTIRFSVKVFDESHQVRGILVINVNGYVFFDIINRYEALGKEMTEIGLLDEDNYWSLSHVDQEQFAKIELIMQDEKEDETNVLLTQYIGDGKLRNIYIDGNYYYINPIDITNEQVYRMTDESIKWYVIGHFNENKVVLAEGIFMTHPYLSIFLAGLSIAYILYKFVIIYQIKSNNQILFLASKYVSDNSKDGILIINSNKEITYCNKVFEHVFDYPQNEVVNYSLSKFLMVDITFKNGETDDHIIFEDNVWIRIKDGSIMCKHLIVKIVRNRQNKGIYYIGIFSNPKISVESPTNSILDMNCLNLLSAVGNEILIDELHHGVSMGKDYTVSIIKFHGSLIKLFENDQVFLGQFFSRLSKGINQSFKTSSVVMPRTDTMLLIIEVGNLENYVTRLDMKLMMNEGIRVLDKMIKVIKRKMALNDVDLGYYIGNAQSWHESDNLKDVISHALIALEVLLKFKGNKYLLYDEKYLEFLLEDKKIRNLLADAFIRREMMVAYQPQYDIDQKKIIGFEALVRWHNPEAGHILPNKFIPILEEDDQILKLGRYVMDQIKMDLIQSPIDFSGFRVSINLSAREYLDDSVIQYMIESAELLKAHNIQLCVEITETVMVENLKSARAQSSKLHERGIRISIDDFGTGYSSLSYLKNLLADELKIDRAFIFEYPHEDDGNLISAILEVGRKLGISNLVEGVESQEQFDFLEKIGGLYYQGFYSSKPLFIKELEDYISNYR